MNEIRIVPFDMKYLGEYYHGFNAEITKYQWPDPFDRMDDAKAMLQEFLDEMQRGETLLYSVVSDKGAFLGSVEMHGLSGDCPELGVWIIQSEQRKGYAYAALNEILNVARSDYHKTAFFYEADIRNMGSTRLLWKFEDSYEIIRQELEETVTDSGKELKLQGYVLKAK
ncbi:MAG: GNAT family N-acetyltransferase [Ruminococcaceae bacterium]|nr:GNAT family N-acetyltransferase [Oscillospiraceae bacterium]